jgi:hypothetical protein
MNLLIIDKVREPGAPKCRCGARLILVRKILNSTNGVTVRMLECAYSRKNGVANEKPRPSGANQADAGPGLRGRVAHCLPQKGLGLPHHCSPLSKARCRLGVDGIWPEEVAR